MFQGHIQKYFSPFNVAAYTHWPILIARMTEMNLRHAGEGDKSSLLSFCICLHRL